MSTETKPEFQGTCVINVGPFSSWPAPFHSLITRNSVDGGECSIWGTPEGTLLIVLKKSGERPYWIETCFLKYEGPDPILTSFGWSERGITLFVNGELAASNEPDKRPADQIVVGVPSASAIANVRDFREINREQIRRRAESARALGPKKGRRLLTLEETVDDLNQATMALNDLTGFIEQGRHHFEATLASTLRAILCAERGQSYPLLQRAAGFLELPLIVYATPPEGDPEDDESLVLQFRSMVNLKPIHSTDTAIDLDHWLTLRGATVRGAVYSNDQVIRAVADTRGSHYDPSIEPLVEETRKYASGLGAGGPLSIVQVLLLNVAHVAIGLAEGIVTEAGKERSSPGS